MDKHITNRPLIFYSLFCFVGLQNIRNLWSASTNVPSGRQFSGYLLRFCRFNGHKPMSWLCGLLSAILFVILVTPLHAQSENVEIDSVTKIGGNRPVQMARPTWDTGWFQAEVYRQLLLELGYQVERPRTFESDEFYRSVAAGEVDFWANGWLPQQNIYLTDGAAEKISVVGVQVKEGALQGYLIDKKSADALNITSLADFKRAEVASHFDKNGDGLADLIGCDTDWSCGKSIESHLQTYQVHDTVEQVQGGYSPLMANAIELYNSGESLFAYSWTPSWMIGELIPGEDVVWLNVPLPAEEGVTQEQLIIPDIPGCTLSPCSLGYPPNDIRTVANRDFLEVNRAIQALLEAVVIPLDDISAQNAMQIKGEGEESDIERHASEWLASRRELTDRWLVAAIKAHDETLITDANVEKSTTAEFIPRPSLRVVTRVLEPFVIYDANTHRYTGFSIELWDLIAHEAHFEYELYGVNTVAKLLDEVDRGAADVAAGGLSITVEREKLYDFSHAYFDSGLQVLVTREERELWGHSLINLLQVFFSPQILKVLGVMFACLLISSHIMWLSERHIDEDFSRAYWPGIWESLWWSAVTATTVGYGDKTPRTVPGRLVGLVWMFSGLFLLASFTASIATTFAINEITGDISEPSDLFDKRVATVERSAAEEHLKKEGVRHVLFPHEDAAYEALLDKKVDAFVYDAPVLKYYINNNSDQPIELASEIFQKHQYAFALSHDLKLREDINLALLYLVESGKYDALYTEWFGK